MGFFTLPLASLVGERGKVVCVDLQGKMIEGLMRRAKKAGLAGRIDARICTQRSLKIDDLTGKIDFAMVFALVHEVPDKKRLFSEVSAAMKEGAKLLLAEPKGHVSKSEFEETVSIARRVGFDALRNVDVRRSRAVLLETRQAGI
jgi:ubiquinone/menaquinone biosynthesis C-methylase UbiE